MRCTVKYYKNTAEGVGIIFNSTLCCNFACNFFSVYVYILTIFVVCAAESWQQRQFKIQDLLQEEFFETYKPFQNLIHTDADHTRRSAADSTGNQTKR